MLYMPSIVDQANVDHDLRQSLVRLEHKPDTR
jgi:hypothetical protein